MAREQQRLKALRFKSLNFLLTNAPFGVMMFTAKNVAVHKNLNGYKKNSERAQLS